jgi:hypothetical protein
MCLKKYNLARSATKRLFIQPRKDFLYKAQTYAHQISLGNDLLNRCPYLKMGALRFSFTRYKLLQGLINLVRYKSRT